MDHNQTGEVFFMREPFPMAKKFDPQKCSTNERWMSLVDVIIDCGGTVHFDAPIYPKSAIRNPMYIRDVGLILQANGNPNYISPEVLGNLSHREIDETSVFLEHQGLAKHIKHPGRFEGGNVVFDSTRNILFVGISNYDQMNGMLSNDDMKKFDDDLWEQKIENPFQEIHRITNSSKAIAHESKKAWLDHMRTCYPNEQSSHSSKAPPRVVPVFIADEHCQTFYHLDGAFNILPTGEAVVCREVLSKAALHLLDKHIGRDNMIEITAHEAMSGATNFITVGYHIITPYASDAMKDKFQSLGYEVIDPTSRGLPSDAWNFSEGAGPRCATLKLTPDFGFPEQQQVHCRQL